MGGLQFQHGNPDASGEVVGSEAGPRVRESETSSAGGANEQREMDRIRRLARPLAFAIFALLGLFAVLLLYTWTRLDQLTRLGQQREERATAAQKAMQEAITKQRAALDRAIQQMAPPSESSPKVSSPGKEGGDLAPAPPVHEQREQAKASEPHQPEPRAAPRHSTGQTVTQQDRPVATRPGTSGAVPAVGQEPVEAQNQKATRGDPPASVQASSPPPTEQVPSAQQAPEAIQEEQREGGESPGEVSSQLDTAVAHNHDEIERLRKLGRRDYVEFTLVRSGNRQEVAPGISLELRKVDSKRSRCSLDVYAEDYEFPTDLVINEPVTVRVRAMWDSVELVVNKMGKDTVAGYLSAGKGVLGAGR